MVREMGTKFTPGPWKARKMKQHTAIESEFRRVAMVGACYGPNCDSDADARLIAAAPEMYEALETALEALHHTLRNVCNSPKYCTRCKVEAVLAKARGEENQYGERDRNKARC